jgi:hypothetical protein
MTIEEFNLLVEKKLGINPHVFITAHGIPSMHMTDYLVFSGKIFEDYLKEFDFWGTIGLDCVVGRLDHFVHDSDLVDCDVWSDDIDQLNANFVLWRNTEKINTLFKKIPDWEKTVGQERCFGCLDPKGNTPHTLWITDEVSMSIVLQTNPDIRWKHPEYYLIHSHDRLENHKPDPKLEIKDDGSLWELIADTVPGYGRRWPFFGREIAYFHFSGLKKWPM